MANITYEGAYNIKIDNLTHNDVSYLYEALVEKNAKEALNETPAIFDKIINICKNILKKEIIDIYENILKKER